MVSLRSSPRAPSRVSLPMSPSRPEPARVSCAAPASGGGDRGYVSLSDKGTCPRIYRGSCRKDVRAVRFGNHRQSDPSSAAVQAVGLFGLCLLPKSGWSSSLPRCYCGRGTLLSRAIRPEAAGPAGRLEHTVRQHRAVPGCAGLRGAGRRSAASCAQRNAGTGAPSVLTTQTRRIAPREDRKAIGGDRRRRRT